MIANLRANAIMCGSFLIVASANGGKCTKGTQIV